MIRMIENFHRCAFFILYIAILLIGNHRSFDLSTTIYYEAFYTKKSMGQRTSSMGTTFKVVIARNMQKCPLLFSEDPNTYFKTHQVQPCLLNNITRCNGQIFVLTEFKLGQFYYKHQTTWPHTQPCYPWFCDTQYHC